MGLSESETGSSLEWGFETDKRKYTKYFNVFDKPNPDELDRLVRREND